MDKSTILADLDTSINNLAKTIESFPEEDFNKNSSETTWCAAQIAEHLLLLERIAVQAINGATIPTNRPADNKIALIKWAMEDETKRQAPQIVFPSGTITNAQELIQQIKEEREKLKAAIANVDITEACKEVKHPALGTLTRLEWIYFTIYHTERHRRQIENLKNKQPQP